METLGELLRKLRKQRGLTQERLAARAHVTARTLRSWETNQQQPREVELESVLNALKATSEEKLQVYALLPDTRTMRVMPNVIAPGSIPPSLSEQMPGVGDLLRAMRVRRGWTQEQFADEMKVSRTSVSRWETTRNLPSEEALGRLCLLLNASQEEKDALSAERLLPNHWSPQLTLEECRHQYELIFQMRLGEELLPLTDLHALALKRQLRLLLPQVPEALRLLSMVEVQHSWWLYMHGRVAESYTGNWRALNMVRGTFMPEEHWVWALNVLSAHASKGKNNGQNAIRLLAPWLQILPTSLHYFLLCDMALYAGWADWHTEAHRFLQQAEQALLRSVPGSSGGKVHTDWYYRVTTARVLLSMGKAGDAMEWLPTMEQVGAGSVMSLLLRAEVFLAIGEKNIASTYLREVQSSLLTMPLPHCQNTFDQLARQL